MEISKYFIEFWIARQDYEQELGAAFNKDGSINSVDWQNAKVSAYEKFQDEIYEIDRRFNIELKKFVENGGLD